MDIYSSDLTTIKTLGYEVMGPGYNWLIENDNDKGFIEIPSSLTV